MLNLKKIAITGTIASGKSTVSSYLQKKNGYVVDADKIGHTLLNPQTDTGKKIIELLGEDILVDKKFDRKKIASKVFNHREKLQALEKIIHPLIIQEIHKEYEKIDKNQYAYFVVDIPLLYEMKEERYYDFVILVITDRERAVEFFRQKGFDKDEYDLRVKNLIPIEEKMKKADFIIRNTSGLPQLYNQIEKIIQKINQ